MELFVDILAGFLVAVNLGTIGLVMAGMIRGGF